MLRSDFNNTLPIFGNNSHYFKPLSDTGYTATGIYITILGKLMNYKSTPHGLSYLVVNLLCFCFHNIVIWCFYFRCFGIPWKLMCHYYLLKGEKFSQKIPQYLTLEFGLCRSGSLFYWLPICWSILFCWKMVIWLYRMPVLCILYFYLHCGILEHNGGTQCL